MTRDRNETHDKSTFHHPYRKSIFEAVSGAKEATYSKDNPLAVAATINSDLSSGKFNVFSREEAAQIGSEIRAVAEKREKYATKLKTKYAAILASSVPVMLAALAFFKAALLSPLILAFALILALILATGLAESEAVIVDAKRATAVCDRLDKHCESMKPGSPSVEELAGEAVKLADAAESLLASKSEIAAIRKDIDDIKDRLMRLDGAVSIRNQRMNVRVDTDDIVAKTVDHDEDVADNSAVTSSQQDKREKR